MFLAIKVSLSDARKEINSPYFFVCVGMISLRGQNKLEPHPEHAQTGIP